MILQLTALVLMLGLIGGLLYLFLRRGVKIKPDPDRKNEDCRNITLGRS